eukprot:TRINITY_DN22324_c0_g1_i1.p1 TRINITY_DN22324_c0_g1~~TRINITY_DN22324_c0_g1_i1.p1  ORF type:complete len:571 (-),score=97.01 TRINITY_DN22324_c0_g1_i1:359-2071(-)
MAREQSPSEPAMLKAPLQNKSPPRATPLLQSLPAEVLRLIIKHLDARKLDFDTQKWRRCSRRGAQSRLYSRVALHVIAKGEAAALLWSYMLPKSKPFVGFSDCHSLRCKIRCSTIVLQKCKTACFRIPSALCAHQDDECDLDAAPLPPPTCDCFRKELCEIACYSLMSCPVRQLFLGRLELFSAAHISAVIIPFLRSISATVQHICVPCQTKRTCDMFAASALRFPRLESLCVDCTHDGYELHKHIALTLLQSVPCARQAGAVLSRMSVTFSAKVPVSEQFIAMCDKSKQLTLVRNSLDVCALSTFENVERIDWTCQPFDFSHLRYLKPKATSKLRRVCFYNIEPLFPAVVNARHYRQLVPLIHRLHVKHGIALSMAGIRFLSQTATCVQVLQIAVTSTSLASVSRYIAKLKLLKVLDLDVMDAGCATHVHDECKTLWRSIIGCDAPLEHLRVSKGSMGLQVFVEVLRKFRKRLRAFHVPLMDDELESEHILVEVSYRQLRHVLEWVALGSALLKRLCVLQARRLEAFGRGTTGGEHEDEVSELEMEMEMFDKASFYGGIDEWREQGAAH